MNETGNLSVLGLLTPTSDGVRHQITFWFGEQVDRGFLHPVTVGYCPPDALVPESHSQEEVSNSFTLFQIVVFLMQIFTKLVSLRRLFKIEVKQTTNTANLRLSCSICWMELERVRPCGAGGPVGRCHVVVLFTWSTKKILPWLSIRASQSER